MAKKPPFKMLPFSWRRDVMRGLKGINLSVWLYHYWRTNAGNKEVTISLDELEAEVPYSRRQIKYSRAWLVKNGWLVSVTPTQKDECGRWTIPTYAVAVGAKATHGVRVRERRTPSGAEKPQAAKTPYMKKPFIEEVAVATQTVAREESEVNEVSEPLASLATTDSDASHPTDKTNAIGKQRGRDEAYYVGEALYSIGLRPNEAILPQVFEAHPDFVWNSETYGAVKRVLGTKYWKSHVKTLENFRHYWSKSGGKGLYAQILRELPDEVPAAEDVYLCCFCSTPLGPDYRGTIASTLDTCCFQCAQERGEKFEGFVPNAMKEVGDYLEDKIDMCEEWCKLPEGHDGGCAGTTPKFVTEDV